MTRQHINKWDQVLLLYYFTYIIYLKHELENLKVVWFWCSGL